MVQAHYCYAHAITARYWDEEAANAAQARYRQVAAGGLPQQLPCHTLPRGPVGLVALMRACSCLLYTSPERAHGPNWWRRAGWR